EPWAYESRADCSPRTRATDSRPWPMLTTTAPPDASRYSRPSASTIVEPWPSTATGGAGSEERRKTRPVTGGVYGHAGASLDTAPHNDLHGRPMTSTVEPAAEITRDEPEAYIARDRRWALATHRDMPDRVAGAALFADISGFT